MVYGHGDRDLHLGAQRQKCFADGKCNDLVRNLNGRFLFPSTTQGVQ